MGSPPRARNRPDEARVSRVLDGLAALYDIDRFVEFHGRLCVTGNLVYGGGQSTTRQVTQTVQIGAHSGERPHQRRQRRAVAL